MAQEKIYMALPFARSAAGHLVPGAASRCACERSAAAKADELAQQCAGALAFSRSIDPASGASPRANLLTRIGDVPKLDYLLGASGS